MVIKVNIHTVQVLTRAGWNSLPIQRFFKKIFPFDLENTEKVYRTLICTVRKTLKAIQMTKHQMTDKSTLLKSIISKYKKMAEGRGNGRSITLRMSPSLDLECCENINFILF